MVNADRYLRDCQAILTSEDRRELGIRPRPKDPVFNLSFNDLNLCGERIQRNFADTDLLVAFNAICRQIPRAHLPLLNGNLRENASTIRTWLAANAVHLNGITTLDLRNLNLTSLPPEILLLNNLNSLALSENPIAALPAGFNPPVFVWKLLPLRLRVIASLPYLELPYRAFSQVEGWVNENLNVVAIGALSILTRTVLSRSQE